MAMATYSRSEIFLHQNLMCIKILRCSMVSFGPQNFLMIDGYNVDECLESS